MTEPPTTPTETDGPLFSIDIHNPNPAQFEEQRRRDQLQAARFSRKCLGGWQSVLGVTTKYARRLP